MAAIRSQIALFTKRVRDFMTGAPYACPLGTTVLDAIGGMAAARASSILVVDGAGRAAGILTEQDIARRVAFQVGAETPVESLMSRPVMAVAEDDYLYRAVGRMRRQGLRHMPVVDAAGRPVGVLDLHEALAAAAATLVAQIDRLTQEHSIEGLARTKEAQVELAQALLDDNLPVPEIQSLITDINQDIHRRVLAANVGAMEQEGWGAPPVPFTLLIMGSGGRGENFLFPDQDNGFILADYPDAEHNRIDAWFIALAERFTRDLDRVGFPLCKGNVMATNPLWRKTSTQWRHQFRLWAERRSPVAVLFSDIFLDFLPIMGPAAPADELRAAVIETLARAPALLAAMCEDETGRSVALGFLGRIRRDSTGEHPGRVDLKIRGTMPLVASARLLSLKYGVPATGTLARLAGLAGKGIVDRNEYDELAAAFSHVTFVLLRQQLADSRAGRRVGNFVEVDSLSRRERDLLVDSLKAIESLRKRVRADLTGALW